MKPFVKWAGGKRQILDKINEFINDSIVENSNYTYIEPFLGGGAVFFDRQPTEAIINDLNSDLINAYMVIKSSCFNELIALLKKYDGDYRNDPDDFYYAMRAKDRDKEWISNSTPVQKAARMIFLNRTCYNGLYRVNSKGQFNTPLGRYKNPTICDENLIKEIHEYLSNPKNNIQILNGSYENAMNKAKDGDVIYIDPPYDYEDDDGFTKYQMAGFTFDDFVKLKNSCDLAIDKGAFVIISNNATEKVINLFEQDHHYKVFYDISKFFTLRNINCNAQNRRSGKEVIIWGIPNGIPFPQANNMWKIIKLVLSDNDVLNDKERAKNLIEVNSTRQVAYYLSALLYLNYITQDRKLSERALKYKNDKEGLIKDIYEQLKENKLIDNQLEK